MIKNCAAILILSLILTGSKAFARTDGPDLSLNTIVIDAGHGGKDAGTVSADRKTYEKSLTLKISKLFAQKIRESYPAMNVILTRETDVFVPLNDRALKASKSNAQLFVSIHINAAAKSKTPNGFSAYILGPAKKSSYDSYDVNMEALQRENSVIYLEEDYSTKYQDYDPNSPESEIFMQLMQNAFREQSLLFAESVSLSMDKGPFRKNWGVMQGNFCVLRQASMPAVLLEFGFMTNSDDLALLRNEEKINTIVDKLFESFAMYKEVYDSSVALGSTQTDTREQEKKTESIVTMYGIQVLASGKEMSQSDPYFKGFETIAIHSGKLYKYILCPSDKIEDVSESFKAVRRKFPDSFIVKITGDNVEIIR